MSWGSNEDGPIALISLGSNLGDSRCVLSDAAELLERFSTRPLVQSSFWRSRPVDCPPDSDDFVNAAVTLFPFPTEIPETLLAKLQDLEQHFGRRPKTRHNEPRILDLDLIAFGQEVRNTPGLTLPHPRASIRRFVLAPLAEIAPNFILPGQTRSIADLAAELAVAEPSAVWRM
jgi:2-amino-4-hydroxy-6-hydroxymethyldihydropteridine diphosphokinase